jgi:hypothetical protein
LGSRCEGIALINPHLALHIHTSPSSFTLELSPTAPLPPLPPFKPITYDSPTFFTMVALKSFLLVASTALLSLTQAVPVFLSGDKTVDSIASALVCPTGQVLFKAHNEGIVPVSLNRRCFLPSPFAGADLPCLSPAQHTTPSAVWKHIGDFSDVEWQGFTLLVCPALYHPAITTDVLTSFASPSPLPADPTPQAPPEPSPPSDSPSPKSSTSTSVHHPAPPPFSLSSTNNSPSSERTRSTLPKFREFRTF